ncbi:MAG TPA: CBS domain-containing protein [Methanoregulaceae archaeon]|nr:CBS domain-containing protein [Methanoregulaceae archaeon]
MNGSFRIGSLFGIPIYIHWTFLVVIPLFAWIIGTQIALTVGIITGSYNFVFGWLHPFEVDTSLFALGLYSYVLGALIALGLFGGVLIHEVAHSVVARHYGLKINSITLLIFGGVSSIEEGTPDPRVELPVALVGPLTSCLVAILCSGIAYASDIFIADRAVASTLIFFFGYLGLLNFILFVFNLLPAFPMDGGRVLRAWLARSRPLPDATRIAANIGKAFAVIFGIIAIIVLNPILIIIAFFIYIGAGQEENALRYNFLLKDVTVGDMMSRPVAIVPPDMPVHEVINQMYASKHLGFPVAERGVLIGMITVADVHKRSPIDRDALQVRDIMTREIITLPPGAPVIDALRIMTVQNIGRIPVIDNNELVGIVTRTDILKVIELKEV